MYNHRNSYLLSSTGNDINEEEKVEQAQGKEDEREDQDAVDVHSTDTMEEVCDEEEKDTSEDEEETADTSEDDDSDDSEDEYLYDVMRGERGFVRVGDIVKYLGQLVCVVLSLCNVDGYPFATCKGIDTTHMELDESSTLTFSTFRLVSCPSIKVKPKLKLKIQNIKKQSLEAVDNSQKSHRSDARYLHNLFLNQSLSFVYEKIQEFLVGKATKKTFNLINTHILRDQFHLQPKNNFCFEYLIEKKQFKELDDMFGKLWDVHILENDDRMFFYFIRFLKIKSNLGGQKQTLEMYLEKCTSTQAFHINTFKKVAIESLHTPLLTEFPLIQENDADPENSA